MAIGGSATGAFWCVVQANWLQVSSTTTLRSECVPVDKAVDSLSKGERVLVQAYDMAQLRQALRGQGVHA
jgi:hypothetical protein